MTNTPRILPDAGLLTCAWQGLVGSLGRLRERRCVDSLKVRDYRDAMKFRTIGAVGGEAGIEVSAIGLGAMPMSIQGRPDEEHSVAVIHAALDAGITFIDTADAYCLDDSEQGHNERLIAKALAARPQVRVVMATKGGMVRPNGAWKRDARPEHLRAACERSLKNLAVECIDIYQLHAPDPYIDFADSIGALADLWREGKIRNIGLSNVGVEHIREAEEQVPVACVQNRCNLFDTSSFENGVIDYCAANGIAFLPHSPVGGHGGHTRVSQNKGISELATRLGASPYQIMIAYLIAVSPCMIPIPGASKISSIESSAAAADITLPEAELATLRRLFPNAVPRA